MSDATELNKFEQTILDVCKLEVASVFALRLEDQIVEVQGYKVLIVSGEIDLYTAAQFKQSIISILDGGERHLIIDMHNIRFVDCTGISTLMSAVKRVSSNTGTVNLVGCKSQLVRILCITAMYAFIALHQSIEDAIEAISGLASHCSALDEMPVLAECHSLDTMHTTYI